MPSDDLVNRAAKVSGLHVIAEAKYEVGIEECNAAGKGLGDPAQERGQALESPGGWRRQSDLQFIDGFLPMLRNKTSRERYESLAMGPASRTLRSKLASKTP